MTKISSTASKILFASSLSLFAICANALVFQADIQLTPTAGAIDFSTITVDANKTAFYDTTQMFNDGYKTSDGKFAMKLFHYGSGTGFFDITPAPSTIEVIDNNGSDINVTHLISSTDAKYATILVSWDSIPSTLSYACDDYCLASPLGVAVGIDDNLSYEADNNITFNSETNTTGTYNIQNGWQLLGAKADINATKFDGNCTTVLWKYDNANWQVHISDGNTYSIPSEISIFDTINKGEGFWVLSNSNANCSIDTTESNTTN